MSFKKELLKKVPAAVHKGAHFQALLELIKQNKIGNQEHLVRFLEQKTALVERWLEEGRPRGSTAVKTRRDQAIHLSVLKKCQKLVKEFLP